jgi:hypothetical protein
LIGLLGRQFSLRSLENHSLIGVLSSVLQQNTKGYWHKNTLQNTLDVLEGIFALPTLGN